MSKISKFDVPDGHLPKPHELPQAPMREDITRCSTRHVHCKRWHAKIQQVAEKKKQNLYGYSQ